MNSESTKSTESPEGSAGTGVLTLYMHSAPQGRKLDAIRSACNELPVAFAMDTDREIIEGRTWCNWGEAFKSVVGNGIASIVTDVDEKILGLQLLMRQQMVASLTCRSRHNKRPASRCGKSRRRMSPERFMASPSQGTRRPGLTKEA